MAPVLAAEPLVVAMSPLELATVASRLGLGPWRAEARRAVGLDDVGAITSEECASALVGLVRRGLVALGPADGSVEVHPAAAAVAAVLHRVSVVVEAPSPDEPGRRRVLALVPGAGGLLIDAGPGDLLLVPFDVDVPVDVAVEVLGEGRTWPST